MAVSSESQPGVTEIASRARQLCLQHHRLAQARSRTEISETVDGRGQRASVLGMLKRVPVPLEKHRVDLIGNHTRKPHDNFVSGVVVFDGTLNDVIAVRVGDVRQIT
jgi:hypothetical protein